MFGEVLKFESSSSLAATSNNACHHYAWGFDSDFDVQTIQFNATKLEVVHRIEIHKILTHYTINSSSRKSSPEGCVTGKNGLFLLGTCWNDELSNFRTSPKIFFGQGEFEGARSTFFSKHGGYFRSSRRGEQWWLYCHPPDQMSELFMQNDVVQPLPGCFLNRTSFVLIYYDCFFVFFANWSFPLSLHWDKPTFWPPSNVGLDGLWNIHTTMWHPQLSSNLVS